LLRHTEPGFLGIPLSFVGFALPLAAMLVLRSKLDPNLTLPLGSRFGLYYLLSGAVAIVISSLIAWFLKRSNLPRAAKAVKTTAKQVRAQR
jgi:L-lactate permease